jgi:hypothetical protein
MSIRESLDWVFTLLYWTFDFNFGEVPMKYNFFSALGGLDLEEVLMLTLGRLHVKHAVERQN